jgi:lipoate synthase
MVGTLVFGLIGPFPVWAKSIEGEITVTPVKTVTPEEESVISSAAVKVLRHIVQARGDIKEKARAKEELNKSLDLIDIIKASLPTAKVKDHIWVAKKHLDYESTEEVMPDMVPIYTALDEIEDLVPVKQAKKHLDEDKEYRDLLVFLLWKRGAYTNAEIGEAFGVTYTAVSHIEKKVKSHMKANRKCRKKYECINSQIKM